jgi:fructosamine-3-kinase
MISQAIQNYLSSSIAQKQKSEISSLRFYPVGGGSINHAFKVIAGDDQFCLKLNSSINHSDFFVKEKNGLEFLKRKNIICIPEVVSCNVIDNTQILLLEWIDSEQTTNQFWKRFGEQLANLHYETNSSFGFEEDNYIGALPQINTAHENWNDFFIHCRIIPQINLAVQKKLLQTKHVSVFENIYKNLSSIFNEEKPSLLHGDLWSGNFMCNKNLQPVLIDPAIYFGHRSMDLAMTTLFGGFGKSFYESYNHHFPFPHNYQKQWEICNLYPLLIHLNLFGSSYLHQIENTLQKFR